MKPNHFVLIAGAAVLASAAALMASASNNRWTEVAASGAKLMPQLAARSGDVAAIALSQGEKSLTLERKETRWGIKERGGYPVEPEKLRALLTRLADAELLEAKTRRRDRYALLELEDPAAKDAKSRGLRLLDGKGTLIDEVVLGKRRFDAFGSGKSGTYARRPADAEAWLTNAEIEVPLDVKSWIKPGVFEIDSAAIKRMILSIAGEPELKLERGEGDGAKPAFADAPKDKKLKDANAADAMLRAVAAFEADDVRKLDTTPAGDGVSTVAIAMKDGAEITLRLRKDGDGSWISAQASGADKAKAAADAINAKTTGWEFKIPGFKADAILKKRGDLYEAGSAG